MRHAILILAHHKPSQLARLVGALRHDDLDIFIHVDRRAYRRDPQAFAVPGARVIAREAGRWGGCGIVRATLHLLQEAVTGAYHTYSLISGSDYPLVGAEHLVRRLDQMTRSHIDHWTDEDPSWHLRYARHRFNDLPTPLRVPLNAASRRLAQVLPPRKAPQGMTIYFGSQWWTLTHEGALAALAFARHRADVLRWYRTVHLPDESYFQTALAHVRVPMARETYRYLDWSARQAHPKTLGLEDLAALRAFAERGGLFARKFDEEAAPGILGAVDAMRLEAAHHTVYASKSSQLRCCSLTEMLT